MILSDVSAKEYHDYGIHYTFKRRSSSYCCLEGTAVYHHIRIVLVNLGHLFVKLRIEWVIRIFETLVMERIIQRG